jgi:hypothetical protein
MPTNRLWAYAGIIALVCFAPSVFADSIPVNLTLTSPPPGPSRDGIYISPYTANINGVSSTIICDDFLDDTVAGGSWQATVNNFGSLQRDLRNQRNHGQRSNQLPAGPVL